MTIDTCLPTEAHLSMHLRVKITASLAGLCYVM